ncbi:MAG: hypothetical protein KGM99_01280 [Burkholderiales bacterium]|nr:hypothetical protein [Burkholderiales bacterium]
MRTSSKSIVLTMFWVALLALFFAQVEIQIEGASGWGGNLPTWRIEKHWLLDIFWGGRAMTGYHAWVFPFIALFFHFPFFLSQRWTLKMECRIIACIIAFWIIEDFMWFVMNPAYGLARFTPQNVPWHIHWLWVAPVDYWIGIIAGSVLMRYSCRPDAGASA